MGLFNNSELKCSDKLFFSVYRNTFIRKCIFSNLNQGIFKLGYYKYDEIIDSFWLISNGYYNLLMDKIIRNEYLTFKEESYLSSNHIQISYTLNRDEINRKYDKNDNDYNISINKYSIFNKEISNKANWNSNNFYNHLFKNYSNHFIKNGNFKITLNFLIEYDNLEALNSLINSCNSNNKLLKFKTFYKAFEIGSYDCALYIFKYLGMYINRKLLKNEEYLKLWSLVLIIDENSICGIHNNFIKLNKRVDFLINKCNLPPPQELPKLSSTPPPPPPPLYQIFDFLIFNQKLSTIIESIKSILLLKDLFKNYLNKELNKKSFLFKSKLNNKNLKAQDILNQDISSSPQTSSSSNLQVLLDFSKMEFEINSNKFTNEQLNTILYEFNFLEIPILVKLYKFLIFFTFEKSFYFLDSFIFLKMKCLSYNQECKELFKFDPSLFGIYNFESISKNSILSIGKLTIFQYCKFDNDKKKNYIKKLIENYEKAASSPTHYSNYLKSIVNIFLDLIKLDDIELVNQLLQSSSNDQISIKFENQSYSIGQIFRNIKSIEMFDIILNSKDSITYSNYNNNTILKSLLIGNNSKILLNHFKNNYNSKYKNEMFNLELTNNDYSNNGIPIESIKFIYENLNDVKEYKNVDLWKSSYNFNNLSDYLYIKNLTPYNEYSDNNKCLSQYLKFKQENQDLFEIIVKKGNSEFLDYFLKIYSSKQSSSLYDDVINDQLNYIIKLICENGSLKLYKYIQLNYSNLLNELFENNWSSSQYKTRNRILGIAFDNGHIELVLEMLKHQQFKLFTSSPSQTHHHYLNQFETVHRINNNNIYLYNYFKNINNKKYI